MFGRGQRYVVIVVMIIVIIGTRTIICDNLASFNTAVGDLLHKEDYLPHQPLTHYLTILIIIISGKLNYGLLFWCENTTKSKKSA